MGWGEGWGISISNHTIIDHLKLPIMDQRMYVCSLKCYVHILLLMLPVIEDIINASFDHFK